MRIARVSIVVPTLLFAFFGIFAQRSDGSPAGVISGAIKDPHGAPLGGAVVILLEGRFSPKIQARVMTDAEGRFEIKNLLPGLYSLKISLADYVPFLKSGIQVVAGKIADLSLMLEKLYQPDLAGLGEVSQNDDGEDIKSVLRSTASTRPILRILDSPEEGEASIAADLEAHRATPVPRDSMRGMVNLYTTAYTADPDLMSMGGVFTEFALVKDLNPKATWVVAGIVSDSGFAEVDSMLKFRDVNGHNPSLRLSLGQLPYLAGLSPILEGNLRRLNLYNLDLQDELRVSRFLSVVYGAEIQGTDPSVNSRKIRPRWGVGFQPTPGSRFTYSRTTSLPRLNRTLDLSEGEQIVFASPFQHESGNRLNLGASRVSHSEVAAEHYYKRSSMFIVGAYSDEFSMNRFGLVGSGASTSSKGVRVAYRRSLRSHVDGTVGYTYGGGIKADKGLAELMSGNFHVVAAKLTGDVSPSRTQITTIYRWVSGDTLTIIDPYQEVFESSSPGFTLMVTQAIPYLGKFIPGKLEAQFDVRNLFAKNYSELYNSPAVRRIEFVQPPRTVRGGIKLKF